jgi:nucleoside-diphosphate-sugar epimerase
MKACVTGGTGFMGTLLADRLSHCGDPVRCIVRSERRGEMLAKRSSVEVRIGNLADPQSLSDAFTGCDIVFHTAAFATHWGTRQQYHEINVDGTCNVLHAMAATGVKRLVHFSSFAVYGRQEGLRSEETPMMKSGDFYSDSKVDAEIALRDLAQRFGIQVTVLRPGVIYGPGDPKWIPTVSRNILNGRMRVIGTGRHIAPLVYGEDVVDFAILCASDPRAAGETFNVVSEEEVTWRQFLTTLASNLRRPLPRTGIPYGLMYPAALVMEAVWTLARTTQPPPATRFGLRLLASDWRSDSSKARRMMGFRTRVDHVDGLKATVQWMQTCSFAATEN